MLYTELVVGNNSYKLRLNTKNSVALEKALGYNPISMLLAIENNVMPKLTDVLIILQAALQPYHHGFNMDKVYDLFDEYTAEGHNMFDLIPVLVDVFKQSGYISAKDEAAEGEEGKN